MNNLFDETKQGYKTERNLHFWLDNEAASIYDFSTNRQELNSCIEFADCLPGIFYFFLHLIIVAVNVWKVENTNSVFLRYSFSGFILYALILTLGYFFARIISNGFALYIPSLCSICLWLYLPFICCAIRFCLIMITSKLLLGSYLFFFIYYILQFVVNAIDVALCKNHTSLFSNIVRYHAKKLKEGDLETFFKNYK